MDGWQASANNMPTIKTYLLLGLVFILLVCGLIWEYMEVQIRGYEPLTGINRELTLLENQQVYLYEKTAEAGLSFKQFKELKRIVQAESGWRHFDDEGDVLKGTKNPLDIGLFQINIQYHFVDAHSLGYDIMNWKGNIDYAIHLYRVEGNHHWDLSKNGWG